MKLSHLAPVALAIMPLGKLVSDTLPIDIDIIYIVEILFWEANMCFKVAKYRVCDILLSCRIIEYRFRQLYFVELYLRCWGRCEKCITLTLDELI